MWKRALRNRAQFSQRVSQRISYRFPYWFLKRHKKMRLRNNNMTRLRRVPRRYFCGSGIFFRKPIGAESIDRIAKPNISKRNDSPVTLIGLVDETFVMSTWNCPKMFSQYRSRAFLLFENDIIAGNITAVAHAKPMQTLEFFRDVLRRR